MDAIKKGEWVYVVNGTTVDKGRVVGVYVTKTATIHRVRWHGGVGSFDPFDVFRFEDDACLALADRLTRIVGGLVDRAGRPELVAAARARGATTSTRKRPRNARE